AKAEGENSGRQSWFGPAALCQFFGCHPRRLPRANSFRDHRCPPRNQTGSTPRGYHQMKPALPCSANRLNSALERVRTARVTETCGRVVQLIGLVIESEGP